MWSSVLVRPEGYRRQTVDELCDVGVVLGPCIHPVADLRHSRGCLLEEPRHLIEIALVADREGLRGQDGETKHIVIVKSSDRESVASTPTKDAGAAVVVREADGQACHVVGEQSRS